MPSYFLDLEIWKALWPLVLFPLASALVICLAFGGRDYRASFPVVAALALLGLVTGQIIGLSRTSAVGTVLPAVLGLLGGVMIYLVGTKGKELQAVVVMAVIGLTLNLLVGVYWGARSRAQAEARAVAPDTLARLAVARENARHTAAIQKLLNDLEYAKLKADIDASASK